MTARNCPIRRRQTRPVAPKYDHSINERIRHQRIRVIDDQGEQLGVMTPERARVISQDRGLDLVEVASEATPPVCRIMDYGKYRYEQSRREKANKSKSSSLKIVQLRPKTDTHDLETKMRKVMTFLERGDKVRLVMRLRGRERGLVHRWKTMLREMVADLGENVRVATPPSAEGRGITMLLEPVSN